VAHPIPLPICSLVLVALSLAVGSAAHAVVGFSLKSGSPSTARHGSADVLSSNGWGSAASTLATASFLGLAAGDEVDAISTSSSAAPGWYFSVTASSVGGLSTNWYGDVGHQTWRRQAAGDVFYVSFVSAGPSQVVINQDSMGLVPAVSPNVSWVGAQDDVDGLDMQQSGPAIFFSVGSTAAGYGRADILYFTPAGPAILSTANQLGLRPGDDIDALQMAGATAYFSLTPGSPTLAANGWSPADVLFSAGGAVSRATPAALLGLLATDDVDALASANLSTNDTDGDGIPDAIDNCGLKPNPLQRDGDGDGCGNLCDGDLDQDRMFRVGDQIRWLGVCRGEVPGAECDVNMDGSVDPADFYALPEINSYGAPPGPGIAGVCR
jgi:hypothetical protein